MKTRSLVEPAKTPKNEKKHKLRKSFSFADILLNEYIVVGIHHNITDICIDELIIKSAIFLRLIYFDFPRSIKEIIQNKMAIDSLICT